METIIICITYKNNNMNKQILSEEFRRMQSLANIPLVENTIQEEENLLEKYKEKIDKLREEFITDLKSNLKGVKKLSKEDREKLSKIVRNLTFTVDDIFENQPIKPTGPIKIGSESWDSKESALRTGEIIKLLKQKGYSDEAIIKVLSSSKLQWQPG